MKKNVHQRLFKITNILALLKKTKNKIQNSVILLLKVAHHFKIDPN